MTLDVKWCQSLPNCGKPKPITHPPPEIGARNHSHEVYIYIYIICVSNTHQNKPSWNVLDLFMNSGLYEDIWGYLNYLTEGTTHNLYIPSWRHSSHLAAEPSPKKPWFQRHVSIESLCFNSGMELRKLLTNKIYATQSTNERKETWERPHNFFNHDQTHMNLIPERTWERNHHTCISSRDHHWEADTPPRCQVL